MQPARHPEAAERKQSQQSESPQLLSKMTTRKQNAGVTLSRWWIDPAAPVDALIHSHKWPR